MTAKKDDPSTQSEAYKFMAPKWTRIDTVLGGTDTMRKAGQDITPQHAEEKNDAYDERVAVTTLFNMTDITLTTWVGRAFREPIKTDDISPTLQPHMPDVDLQGNNLGVFTREVFRDGLAKGFSHILVDFPRPTQPEDGRSRTKADDQKENLRPYWVHIRPENLFFAHSEIEGSQEVLKQIRILESTTTLDGFEEVTTQRIRVIDAGDATTSPQTPSTVRIFEKKRSKGRRVEWVETEQWDMGITFIPLVTFYADRKGFMLSKPPIEDVSNLNITHWQSSSDQRSILTVTRFPMLAVSGAIDEDKKLVIGPRKWLHNPNVNGKFYFVEAEGKAMGTGQIDLESLQTQMSQYGAEFVKQRPSRETAQARVLDSLEASSPLQDAVMRFTEAINKALRFHGLWIDEQEPGTVTITTDFGPDVNDSADLTALIETRKNRDISRAFLLKEFKRRGVLLDNMSLEENDAELSQEIADFDGGTDNDLDPDA